MNYAQLEQAIQDETENNDPTFLANIDLFIRRAEKRIYNEIRFPESRRNATSTLTIGSAFIAMPANYISAYAWSVAGADGVVSYLLPKDAEYLRECYPDPAYQARPKFFSQFDVSTFMVGPVPDFGYASELHYFGYPTSITLAPTSTTWLGNNYEHALFYAAVLEAYVFMKGDADIMQTYVTAFTTAMTDLKNYDLGTLPQEAYR